MEMRTSTLFLGNSFVYFNDLPNVLQDMFEDSSTSTFDHDQVTPGGQSLIGHAKDENVKNAFDKRSTTFVVLQDNSQVPGGYDKDILKNTHDVLESYFIPRIQKNNSVPILFQTWAHLRGSVYSQSKKEYPSYEIMQTKTSNGYVEYANILKKICPEVLVAPVGEAFRRVFELDPKGLFCELFSPDTYHPSRLGTLLAALVFFGTMTGTLFSPTSIKSFDPNRTRDFDCEMRRRFGDDWKPKIVTNEKFETLRNAARVAIWSTWDRIHELRGGNLMSRLLYPNPVCMLCTVSPEKKLNVMTVSWLTATDNRGGFLMALNANRFTTKQIRATKSLFTLSIPTRGMEHVLIKIGSCSGFDVDKTKFVHGWTPVAPGWGTTGGDGVMGDVSCVSECVAHIVARVQNVHDIMENGHVLITAKCVRAFVRLSYWRGGDDVSNKGSSSWKGKAVFAPRKQEFRPSPPSILTFLGSKVFGHVNVVAE